MRPVIVHGPQGSGKTRNAVALARFYGKTEIIDDADAILARYAPLDPNTLYLARCAPAGIEGAISIEDALAAMNAREAPSATAVLRELVGRIENLETVRRAHNSGIDEMIEDVWRQAAREGLDLDALRAVVARRVSDRAARLERRYEIALSPSKAAESPCMSTTCARPSDA